MINICLIYQNKYLSLIIFQFVIILRLFQYIINFLMIQ